VHKMYKTTTFLACNFAKYSPILLFFTDRLSNKPFLIWSLTTPPHFKNVATLPCNLSLIARFLTLMFHKVVWQHMLGVGFNNYFTETLPKNQPVKEFRKSVKFQSRYHHEYGVSSFIERGV